MSKPAISIYYGTRTRTNWRRLIVNGLALAGWTLLGLFVTRVIKLEDFILPR